MTKWVPLCPSCRVPLRGEVELHEPPSLTDETPDATAECRFCGWMVEVDDGTKWARIA